MLCRLLVILTTLWGSVVAAWTNLPVAAVRRNDGFRRFSVASPSLFAATLADAPLETLSSNTLHDDDCNDDGYTMNVWNDSQQHYDRDFDSFIQEMTDMFLSSDYPPGSLSWDVLDASYTILRAWSKTNTREGAETAFSILKRIELEQEATHQEILTQKHYGIVVEAFSKANLPKSAEIVLQHLPESPNRIMLNSILSTYARQGNVEQAQRIFDSIDSPETCDYNSLLSAFAKSGKPLQAEEMLRAMVASPHVEPDIYAYNSVLDAWARSGMEGAADRAMQILSSLSIRDVYSYSCVAQAYLQEGSAEKTRELLQQAMSEGLVLDAHLHNHLLEAYSLEGNDADAAEAYLEQMEREGAVNAVSYNTVLKVWMNSGANDLVERAEALFQRIVARGFANDYSYTTLIGCHAKSKKRGSAERAEELLEEMVRSNIRPNTVSVNSVLNALCKSGHVERAQSLLTRIEEQSDAALDHVLPNVISYTTVIDGWARIKTLNAAHSAERIFQQMEAAYKGGNLEAKPSIRAMNAVINAFAQCKEADAAERAEDFLTDMENAFKAGDSDIQPNAASYSTAMKAWCDSDSQRKLEKAVNLFTRMSSMYEAGNINAKPNLYSYNTLIDAMVTSGEKGAAERAQDVVLQMYNEYRNGNDELKPGARLITAVMSCLSRSGARDAGEKAEALLDWMLDVHADEDDKKYQARELAFNIAINAWAKTRRFGKAPRARALLDRMIRMYEAGEIPARPNTIVFTSVINACAYAIGDRSERATALEIATDTFDELCSSDYGDPNHVSYATYLTAIRHHHTGDEKAKAEEVANVFQKCAADGQVSKMVLDRVESTLSSERVKELYSSMGLDKGLPVGINDVPIEWRRNVSDDDLGGGNE